MVHMQQQTSKIKHRKNENLHCDFLGNLMPSVHFATDETAFVLFLEAENEIKKY